jgi:hypothetical protein
MDIEGIDKEKTENGKRGIDAIKTDENDCAVGVVEMCDSWKTTRFFANEFNFKPRQNQTNFAKITINFDNSVVI